MSPIVVTSHAELSAFKVESVLLTATPSLLPHSLSQSLLRAARRWPFIPSFAYLADLCRGKAEVGSELEATTSPIGSLHVCMRVCTVRVSYGREEPPDVGRGMPQRYISTCACWSSCAAAAPHCSRKKPKLRKQPAAALARWPRHGQVGLIKRCVG